MNQPCLKNILLFSIKLIFIFVLYSSCNKSEEIQLSKKTLEKKEIFRWIDKQKKESHYQGLPATIDLLSKNLDFTKIEYVTQNRDTDYYVIPVNESFKTLRKFDPNSKISLVILAQKNTIIKSFIFQYLPLNRKIKSISNSSIIDIYQQKHTNINGKFRFLDISGIIEYQLTHKNGSYAFGTLNYRNESQINTQRYPNKITNSYGEGCSDWYLVTTYFLEDGSTYQDWEYIGTTCSNQDCLQNGEPVPCRGNGSGGGGSNSNEAPNNEDYDDIAELKSIIKNVKNPCLSSILDEAIDSQLKNNLTDILHNTFGAKKDFNITFIDTSLNNNIRDGQTTSITHPNGRIEFIVKLNTEVLLDASKEYVAATIYHEIIHAYLMTAGITGQNLHHNTMAEEYQLKIASALKSIFPSLPLIEADALSWGGLMTTNLWNTYQSNHPSDALNLQVLVSQHRVKTIGSSCN